MTYQNIGYWIGQANDVSTGSHPTGWTNGQRWSETAGEWNTMYNSSQSALSSMTADRNAWQTNANTAYDGGTWASGTHWHARYDTLHNGLNTPDSTPNYVTATGSIGITDGAIATLTLPKAGHWLVSAVCTCSGTWHEQSGTPNVMFTGSGGFSGSSDNRGGLGSGASGSFIGGAGFIAHGAYGAGQTFTVSSTAWRMDSGTRAVTIYAHYVPSTAYDV